MCDDKANGILSLKKENLSWVHILSSGNPSLAGKSRFKARNIIIVMVPQISSFQFFTKYSPLCKCQYLAAEKLFFGRLIFAQIKLYQIERIKCVFNPLVHSCRNVFSLHQLLFWAITLIKALRCKEMCHDLDIQLVGLPDFSGFYFFFCLWGRTSKVTDGRKLTCLYSCSALVFLGGQYRKCKDTSLNQI